MIFVAHYRNLNWPTLFFPRAATFGLSMFAFISAYLLCARYSQFNMDYWGRRIVKIFPTILSVSLFVSIYLALSGKFSLSPDIFFHLTGTSVLTHFMGYPASGLGQGMWFVSFIMCGYILLPLIKKIFLACVARSLVLFLFAFISLLAVVNLLLVISPFSQIGDIGVFFVNSFAWFVSGAFYQIGEQRIPVLKRPFFICTTGILSLGGLYLCLGYENSVLQYCAITLIPFWLFPFLQGLARYFEKYVVLKTVIFWGSTISFEFYLIHLYFMGSFEAIINIFDFGKFSYMIFVFFLTLTVSFIAFGTSQIFRKLMWGFFNRIR